MPAAAVLEGQARHRLPTSPLASDDLARLAAAGTLPRRGAAPVPALLNNNAGTVVGHGARSSGPSPGRRRPE